MGRGREEPLYTSSDGASAERWRLAAEFEVILPVNAQKGQYTA
jgi:hypothetical protein